MYSFPPNDNVTILDEFWDFVRINHSDFVFYTVWWTTPSHGRSSEETILAEFEMHEPPFQFVFDLTRIVLIRLIKRLQLCIEDISQLVSGYNGWVKCVLRVSLFEIARMLAPSDDWGRLFDVELHTVFNNIAASKFLEQFLQIVGNAGRPAWLFENKGDFIVIDNGTASA